MSTNLGFRNDPAGFGAIVIGSTDVAKFDLNGIYGCLPVTSYANDAAAAAAGIKVGGLYHTTGTVKVRLT